MRYQMYALDINVCAMFVYMHTCIRVTNKYLHVCYLNGCLRVRVCAHLCQKTF